LNTDQHPKSAGSLSLSNGSFLRSRYKTRAGNLRGSASAHLLMHHFGLSLVQAMPLGCMTRLNSVPRFLE
jgi:hypothetical protein